MAAPTLVYTNSPKHAVLSLLALGTPKLLLATDSYSPDQDAHEFADDITDEAAGTGYTTGGISLDNVDVLVDTATNTVTLDADDISGISVSCRWAVIYVDTGVPGVSPVVSYTDLSEGLGGDLTVTGIQWDADGILPFVVAS